MKSIVWRATVHAIFLTLPTVLLQAMNADISLETITLAAAIVFVARLLEAAVRSVLALEEGVRYRWVYHIAYGVIAGVAAAGFDVTKEALIAALSAGAIRALEGSPWDTIEE